MCEPNAIYLQKCLRLFCEIIQYTYTTNKIHEISSIGRKYKPNERIRVLRFFLQYVPFFFLLVSVERRACGYNLLLFIFELVTNILYSVEITHIRIVYESNTEFESNLLHVRSLIKSFACYSEHLRSYTIM